ncbi:MAG TPA: DUF456 domain-containing protein [Kineosporiaceae bacterium]|nr:DUF456 domain-containing protein [Kineosporiaceae bacterium]
MTLITAVMIIIGLAGIVVPVLPGLLLVWAGVAVWGVVRHDTAGWVTLGLATLLTVIGLVVKYLLPGRRLRADGVGWPTLAAGAALGVVGFFVIPVVGVVVGFVLGIYLAERLRLAPAGGPGSTGLTPWASTRAALVAVGWSVVIELTTGLLVAGTWVAGAVLA